MDSVTNNPAACRDVVSFLASTPLFAALGEEALRELGAGLELVRVAAGDVLVRQGEPGDGLYVVVTGRVRIEAQSEAGTVRPLGELGPGESLGEIALWTDGKRSATVHAVDDTELVKCSGAAFDHLVEQHPALRTHIAQLIVGRLRRSRLATHLSQVFGPLNEQVLRDIEAEHEWVTLPGGEILFRQGDAADAAYVLLNGRLRVVAEGADGAEHVLNEVAPGETVGEMALLTRDARSATVYAVRDAELAKFSRAAFDRVLDKYPRAMMAIARIIATRLRQQTTPVRSGSRVRTVAVVPASPGVPLTEFTSRLCQALARHGAARRLTSERVDALLARRGISQSSDDDPGVINLVACLNDQEIDHRFVVYEADAAWSSWTQRCIRQADLILLVAQAGADPTPGEIEREIERRNARAGGPLRSLVLLQPDDTSRPSGTERWLAGRRVVRHHHVRLDSAEDFGRLARFVAGRAIGLVLGGGGARGLAHIGVIRALAEAGIPIDLVGGSSIGSALAGGVALGLDHATMLSRWREYHRSFFQFTLPMVSLVSARAITKMLTSAFGDTRIEDLWLPYFCVSTNLSKAEAVVHRQGPLALAVRASTGLPGIVPPVTHDGELLVDGGLINNLPIDVMRTLGEGGPVIAADVSLPVDLVAGANYTSDLSGWQILWSRINPLAERIQIPHILSILTRAAVIGSVRSEEQMRMKGLADLYLQVGSKECGIMDFGSIEKVVAFGYESAARQIEEWQRTEGSRAFEMGAKMDARQKAVTDIDALLRAVDIFAELKDQQIARLGKLATRRAFPAGVQILRRGDSGVALYVVVSGRVAITLESEEGAREQRLGELGPGEVFGEMALLDGGPRSANVTAAEPTECLLINRWDFSGEMLRDADIARALVPVLCQRIRKLHERVLKYEPEATTD